MNMQLHIEAARLAEDVQREFNLAFPYLKLEFFNKVNNITSTKNKRIGDWQFAPAAGIVALSDETKVIDLLDNLKKEYNLNAQILRRSGNLWLQTTMTDSWSLKKQNDYGKELSTFPGMIDF
ncbi:MAG: hypothetical protein C0459_04370 [Chitinophaga sp.]|jgi:hypothetical protein|nr:hypothetical protein [Chitinophaga sp.]